MNKLIFLAVIFACFASVSQAALSAATVSLLQRYDSEALNNIWRAMVNATIYSFIKAFVCASYGAYLADAAGLFSSDDISNAGYDASKLCTAGFDKVYSAVWYRYDNRVYTFGNDDLYNYTI